MTTYAEVTGWRQYQSFFPPEYRLRPDETPKEEVFSWNGMRIHLDRYPVPSARAKLLILHGAGGYGRMLTPWGLFAQRHGFEALAPDMPGYGLTQTNGAIIDYPMWVACTTALVAAERKRDGRPIVLFGGSMGGMLAYTVAAATNAAGLVATCLLDMRQKSVQRHAARLPIFADLVPPLLRLLRFADRVKIPIRWLSNMRAMSTNPKLGELCAKDPLGGGTSVPLRFLRTYVDAVPSVEPDHFTTCPVLLVHPKADAWTPVALSEEFFDRLACPKELVLLDECGHFPIEQPGMGEMEAAIVAFLRRVAGSAAKTDPAAAPRPT
jgi:alpha-beta hydrolase superfamily lysophospholipase